MIKRVDQQRLARSTCAKQAGTNDPRVVWFIGFIAYLGLGATYLVKDVERIPRVYCVVIEWHYSQGEEQAWEKISYLG